MIQRRVWEIVEVAKGDDKASRYFDISILVLIFFNVIAVILESIPSIQQSYEKTFDLFEIFSVAVFTIEYLARLWSCVESNDYNGSILGRIKFIFSPMAVIDLLSIGPFYLPFVGYDLRALRAFRLFRILRIAKVGRYSSSMMLIKKVFSSRKEELVLATAIMFTLLLTSSTVLYHCENEAQPEKFSSIPATMWWAVATLTTVGYGDTIPVTTIGKICASFFSILGIGMFALPTGILGAGFIEEIEKEKRRRIKHVCPHCNKEIAP